jgi:hypothetical protein
MKLLLAVVCLIAYTNSWAGIGTVSDVTGTACSIERAKQKLPGGKGVAIESMDTYVTGGCVSNITFKDDTKVKITENSRLMIDDFVYDPKQSDAGKLALKVGMGTVRYASGQIAKNNPQQVNIKTPTASIAVRGTDFNMTVDEAGQSLVILVPSCRDGEKVKEYELEENMCKVGKIEVSTLAGVVTLDKAFEGTYITSASTMPSPPAIINTVETNISNSLIITRPPEIVRSSREAARTKQDIEQDELPTIQSSQVTQRAAKESEDKEQAESEAVQASQITQRIVKESEAKPTVITNTVDGDKTGCNFVAGICVRWDQPDSDSASARGRGTAFRQNEDHYAEVKTEGYSSNTSIEIAHDDNLATAVIGFGGAGGNLVRIRQNSGVLRR